MNLRILLNICQAGYQFQDLFLFGLDYILSQHHLSILLDG